jgi:hypothetical protein
LRISDLRFEVGIVPRTKPRRKGGFKVFLDRMDGRDRIFGSPLL